MALLSAGQSGSRSRGITVSVMQSDALATATTPGTLNSALAVHGRRGRYPRRQGAGRDVKGAPSHQPILLCDPQRWSNIYLHDTVLPPLRLVGVHIVAVAR